jgi:hypothetical protein
MRYLKTFALFESSSKSTLVVVDVQPSYERLFDVRDYIGLIEDAVDNYQTIVYLYNGEELGMESEDDISYWLTENGLPEDLLGRINFFEKNYGWFRSVMDDQVDESEIVTALKYMLDHNIDYLDEDTDEDVFVELNLPELQNSIQSGSILQFPKHLFTYLDKFNDIDLAGGAADECLREVELVLTAMGKRYDRLEKHIY